MNKFALTIALIVSLTLGAFAQAKDCCNGSACCSSKACCKNHKK